MSKKLSCLLLSAFLLLSGCARQTVTVPETMTPLPTPTPDPVPPNTYSAEAFAVENGFLTYRWDGPCAVGIDVSAHQGEIDWEKVAAAGVEFAMIRAGYRGYTQGGLREDEYFRENMEGAQVAGLDTGVYFFSQATNLMEALEEAEFLLDLLEGYEITYPVVFDWERQSAETSRTKDTRGEVVTACAVAFCRAVETAGYLPMTYASPNKAYSELELARLLDWPFWLAHYTDGWEPTGFRYHYAMWQYSCKGRVDGIEGDVDLDLCLTDFSRWESLAPEPEETGMPTTTPEDSAPSPAPNG